MDRVSISHRYFIQMQFKPRNGEDFIRGRNSFFRLLARDWEAAGKKAQLASESDGGDIIEDLATDVND